MRRYLLDTNIISDLVRHPQGVVAARIRAVGDRSVLTSVIVAAELRYGCRKKASKRLTEAVEAILAEIEIAPFDGEAATAYGDLRAALERKGRLIGGNDMLIAAHALALGVTLVSDNRAEFARVEGLSLDNWLS